MNDQNNIRNYEDIISMTHINEATIIKNFQERYKRELFDTYIGSLLVSFNPLKSVPERSSPEKINEYKTKGLDELKPHAFALAKEAHRRHLTEQSPQAILISGESGSGKTETAKQIMRFLCNDSEGAVKNVLLAGYGLLDAFGNARTKLNNNSTRSCRLVRFIFDSAGNLKRARIDHYAIDDATRICKPPKFESNFHIFHYFCLGEFEEKENLLYNELARDVSKIRLLNQCTTSPPAPFSDFEESTQTCDYFQRCLQAMKEIGMANEEINKITKIISAVIHLGNIEYELKEEESVINDKLLLAKLAELLEFEPSLLEKSLCCRSFRGGGRSTIYYIPLTIKQCRELRDMLCKSLYRLLITYFLKRINTIMCGIGRPGGVGRSWEEEEAEEGSIAVLDMFGFESQHKKNTELRNNDVSAISTKTEPQLEESGSFEQLLINYANDKLRHLYFRVASAKRENTRKAMNTFFHIAQQEVADCLQVFERKQGLFHVLEKESNLLKSGPFDLMQQFWENCSRGSGAERFISFATSMDKLNPAAAAAAAAVIAAMSDNPAAISPTHAKVYNFVVRHFMGGDEGVSYDAAAFLDKNRDCVPPDLNEFIFGSKTLGGLIGEGSNGPLGGSDYGEAGLIASSYHNEQDSSKPRVRGNTEDLPAFIPSAKSFSSRFREQLDKVTTHLFGSQLFHIHCARPNDFPVDNNPRTFDPSIALRQIRGSGFMSSLTLTTTVCSPEPSSVCLDEKIPSAPCLFPTYREDRPLSHSRLDKEFDDSETLSPREFESSEHELLSEHEHESVCLDSPSVPPLEIENSGEPNSVVKKQSKSEKKAKRRSRHAYKLEKRDKKEKKKHPINETLEASEDDGTPRTVVVKTESKSSQNSPDPSPRVLTLAVSSEPSPRSQTPNMSSSGGSVNRKHSPRSPRSRRTPLKSVRSERRSSRKSAPPDSLIDGKPQNVRQKQYSKPLPPPPKEEEDYQEEQLESTALSSSIPTKILLDAESERAKRNKTWTPSSRPPPRQPPRAPPYATIKKSSENSMSESESEAPITPSTSSDYPSSHATNDEEIRKDELHRKNVFNEIITTEREYVTDLLLISEVFLNPLKKNKLLQPREINAIFSNVDLLIRLSREMLMQMKNSQNSIGKIFTDVSDIFKMYTSYCVNYPNAIRTLKEVNLRNPAFAEFLQKSEKDPRCQGHTLKSYLIKPVQRVCKYPLFFKDLLKHTPKNHPHYTMCVSALKKIEDVVESIDKGKELAELQQKIFDIQTSIEGLEGLIEPSRRLVREGMITVHKSKKSCPGKIFLFNDQIIISVEREKEKEKEKEGKKKDKDKDKEKAAIPPPPPYILEGIIHFDSSTQAPTVYTQPTGTYSLRFASKDSVFIISFPKPEERDLWLHEIQTVIQLRLSKRNLQH